MEDLASGPSTCKVQSSKPCLKTYDSDEILQKRCAIKVSQSSPTGNFLIYAFNFMVHLMQYSSI